MKKGEKRGMLRLLGFYDYTVILTYMSLCSAVLGVVCADRGRFTAAVLCVLLSGICDAFDGTVARTKKNRTEDERAFGIQLDSLCDVISFGLCPAYICYAMGVDGTAGVLHLMVYCLCAVIRLAYFNVLEGNRQKTEGGSNKEYRGLPVTTISIVFPFLYIFRSFLPAGLFTRLLYLMLMVVAFLFVLDFRVKKVDVTKLFKRPCREEIAR